MHAPTRRLLERLSADPAGRKVSERGSSMLLPGAFIPSPIQSRSLECRKCTIKSRLVMASHSFLPTLKAKDSKRVFCPSFSAIF